jgi:glutathione S-transferase
MRREPKEELVKKCQSIPGGSDTSAMSKEGPFLDGDKSTMVDVLALALFWQRILTVGSFYFRLKLPEEEKAFKRLKACQEHPSIRVTNVCEPRWSAYIPTIPT